MFCYCGRCKEYVCQIDPLEDERLVECVCKKCFKVISEEAELADEPKRIVGFKPDEPKDKGEKK